MAKSIKKQDPEYCYSEKCDIIDELFDKYCVEYPRCYRMSDMFKYDFSEDTFTMKCEAYTVKIQQDGWMNVSTEPNCGIGELDIEILSRILSAKFNISLRSYCCKLITSPGVSAIISIKSLLL